MNTQIDECGLITNANQCMGYIMFFNQHGAFDAENGKLDTITQEQADKHNAVLDQMMIKGLDDNCQVGQRGSFYLIGNNIQTFCGTLVSNNVSINGLSVTFERNDKTFRGRKSKQHDLFNFKRIK